MRLLKASNAHSPNVFPHLQLRSRPAIFPQELHDEDVRAKHKRLRNWKSGRVHSRKIPHLLFGPKADHFARIVPAITVPEPGKVGNSRRQGKNMCAWLCRVGSRRTAQPTMNDRRVHRAAQPCGTQPSGKHFERRSARPASP